MSGRLGRIPIPEMRKYNPEQGLQNPPPDWKVVTLHNKGMTAGQIAKELGTTLTYIEGTIVRLRNGKKNLEKSKITPWSGGKVQYLPCPVCQNMNPVSQANIRMRCSHCGTRLLSVRIKKSRRNYGTKR